MSETSPMTALERAALEWLAERSHNAYGAASIADAVDHPLPKVQAALTRLRDRHEVAYFDGHPGSWAVTAHGRALVFLDAPYEPTERYRMALETIVECAGNAWFDRAAAGRVAKLALKGRPHG